MKLHLLKSLVYIIEYIYSNVSIADDDDEATTTLESDEHLCKLNDDYIQRGILLTCNHKE